MDYWGGGILQLKSQSVNISDNFHLGGGDGGYSATKKSKCQDLPKLEFFRGGGGILQLKSQSAKIYLNWNFSGGGGILQLKSESTKIYLNWNFLGEWGGGYSATKKSKCQDQ